MKEGFMKEGKMRAAVIGIGSNSVRALICDLEGASGRRVQRLREGTRLFAGLNEQRELSRTAMDNTLKAVCDMARQAREMGAEEVHLFATSATRDASNQQVFADRLLREAGVALHICSGEEEAALSFCGATDRGRCGVIDIGGGSTEIIIGEGCRIDCSFSCQMGAVRMYRLLEIASAADLNEAEHAAEAVLREQLELHPLPARPGRWLGTGGTFTTLAAMAKGIAWTDRTYMHGTLLTLEKTQEIAVRLANMTIKERLTLPGLQPHRADIVVHGICILLACMHTLHIPDITVSEYGNLDGWMKTHYHLEELV